MLTNMTRPPRHDLQYRVVTCVNSLVLSVKRDDTLSSTKDTDYFSHSFVHTLFSFFQKRALVAVHSNWKKSVSVTLILMEKTAEPPDGCSLVNVTFSHRSKDTDYGLADEKPTHGYQVPDTHNLH